MEEHRVVVHVLQEVLVRSFTVRFELDLTVGAIQVQHGVELVITQALESLRQRLLDRVHSAPGYFCFCDSCVQNFSSPSLTR
ncbi:hypothetical protein D3C73_1276920 [compost metagenome]